MPKRSNDFQRLIYLIHHQLAGGAMVTESKFLYDRASNTDREVDIVIEVNIGEYLLMVGVECQGRGRVASVEWVEQMAAKHETLPTDKLILVSQSGFSAAARTKARTLGIEAMTLGQAVRTEWNALVGIPVIGVQKWAVEPAACFAIFTQEDNQMNTLELEFNQQLYDSEGNDTLIVQEVIDIIIDMNIESLILQMARPGSENVSETLNEAASIQRPNEGIRINSNDQKLYTIFKMEFGVPDGTYFTDILGVKREISKLCIIGHFSSESELVNMQSNSFGSAHIAFGKTHTLDPKSLVSIVEHENGSNTAAMMLYSGDKDLAHIVNLREVKKVQNLKN
jgi:hypothetical protein